MRPPPGGLFYLEDPVSEPIVSTLDSNTTTVEEARTWLNQESKNGSGAKCPCCQQVFKTYGRKITPVQAAVLILLYRAHQVGEEVQVQSFVAGLNDPDLTQGRDWGRLVYWDLLEPTQDEKTFRLCDGGYFFVFKKHKITEKAWIRDEVVVERSGKAVDIVHVLGTKFDINTLMHAQVPPAQSQMTIQP
jgi:hypothetical protein